MQVLFQSVPSLVLFNNCWIFHHTCWNFLTTGKIAGLFPAFTGGDGLSRYRADFHEIEVLCSKGDFNFHRLFELILPRSNLTSGSIFDV